MEGKSDTSYEDEAELNPFTNNAKSSVKIKKTTRGPTWEIKVVTGEKDLIEELQQTAIKAYIDIENKLTGGKK